MGNDTWQNWSGSVTCKPVQIAIPGTIDALSKIVRDAARNGRTVRVAGAGHSFTRLVETDGIVVSLDRLTGVESVETEAGRATVWAGTRLNNLGPALFEKGVGQENLGDIDEQSIAGAVSTGTHGTGIKFGSIATQIEALTIMKSDGELLECSLQSNPDLFKAAQVSIGALGLLVKITLRVLPAYKLKRESRRATLDHCLDNLEEYKQNNRNFEFFWFPYSEYCQAKFLNLTDDPPTEVNKFNLFMENKVFSLLSQSCRMMPGLCRGVSRLAGRTIPNVVEVNYSHRIFPTPREVRFQEMEYNVPADHFTATLAEVRECIEREKFAVHFPVECRFVQKDDIWLSPATGRDSAYLAVHMYKGMPFREYFDALEPIFQKHGGRPHWGKMHTMKPEQFAERYPRWNDFLKLRAELDPAGVFLNPYLKSIFGLN